MNHTLLSTEDTDPEKFDFDEDEQSESAENTTCKMSTKVLRSDSIYQSMFYANNGRK